MDPAAPCSLVPPPPGRRRKHPPRTRPHCVQAVEAPVSSRESPTSRSGRFSPQSQTTVGSLEPLTNPPAGPPVERQLRPRQPVRPVGVLRAPNTCTSPASSTLVTRVDPEAGATQVPLSLRHETLDLVEDPRWHLPSPEARRPTIHGVWAKRLKGFVLWLAPDPGGGIPTRQHGVRPASGCAAGQAAASGHAAGTAGKGLRWITPMNAGTETWPTIARAGTTRAIRGHGAPRRLNQRLVTGMACARPRARATAPPVPNFWELRNGASSHPRGPPEPRPTAVRSHRCGRQSQTRPRMRAPRANPAQGAVTWARPTKAMTPGTMPKRMALRSATVAQPAKPGPRCSDLPGRRSTGSFPAMPPAGAGARGRHPRIFDPVEKGRG